MNPLYPRTSKRSDDSRVVTIVASLTLVVLGILACIALVCLNTGCGPGFEIERYGTMATPDIIDGGDASAPTNDAGDEPTWALDAWPADVRNPAEAMVWPLDTGPLYDADASVDTCVASSTVTPNCTNGTGSWTIPLHYQYTVNANGMPACGWEQTPPNCVCAYDCGCVLQFHAGCACKIDNLGLMEVTCQ